MYLEILILSGIKIYYIDNQGNFSTSTLSKTYFTGNQLLPTRPYLGIYVVLWMLPGYQNVVNVIVKAIFVPYFQIKVTL